MFNIGTDNGKDMIAQASHARVNKDGESAHLQFPLIPVFVALIIGIAFYFRLEVLAYLGGTEQDQILWFDVYNSGGIVRGYISMAQSVALGSWSIFFKSYFPGYPAFLALLDFIGLSDFRHVRVAQVLIDSLTILPLYYVARRLSRNAVFALMTALLYAIAPWWAAGSGYLLAESMIPAFVATLLMLMLWVREQPLSMFRWLVLALVAAIVPFFRADFVLLFIPLVLWALLLTRGRHRLRVALLILAVFFLLLLIWALCRYAMTGEFALTPSAGWYALWSGLGQVPNEFGFRADDANAQRILTSLGIGYHSIRAEEYFRSEYLNILVNHPSLVANAILFRLGFIITSTDFVEFQFHWLYTIIYIVFTLAIPIVIIVFLFRRRFLEALIVSGPLLFAMFSLGLVYVEARYVRYAGISAILAGPILLSMATSGLANLAAKTLPWAKQAIEGGSAYALLAGLCLAFAVSLTAFWSQVELAISESIAGTTLVRGLDAVPGRPLAISNLYGDTEKTIGPDGNLVIVSATATSYSYLAGANFENRGRNLVRLILRVRLIAGSAIVGILNADKSRWIWQQTLRAEAGAIQDIESFHLLDPGGELIISAFEPQENRTRLEIEDLSATYVCAEIPVEPVAWLFVPRPEATVVAQDCSTDG